MDFDIGKQPCGKFTPELGIYGIDTHECFCPFKKGEHPCNLSVSFCENCHKDHHENGYDKCKCCGITRSTKELT